MISVGEAAESHRVELEVVGLTKRYDAAVAVDNLTLSVVRGEYLALLGPSGCGKTTTLRMVAGFVIPDAGRVLIHGRDVTYVPPYLREVGLVFQNYALFPHMSVQRNVEFAPKMQGLSPTAARDKANWALGLVRLKGFEGRMPGELSGGQQQRVAVARVLASNPSLVLLDEPFSNLDAKLRQDMQSELKELQQKLAISTIHVTHDQDEAMAMADRIVVMDHGNVAQVGRPRAIYDHPSSRFVAEFMGRCNRLSGRVADVSDDFWTAQLASEQTLTVAKRGGPAPSVGSEVLLFFRPECVSVDCDVNSDRKGLSGVVKRSVFLGPMVMLHVALLSGEEIAAQIPSGDFDDAFFAPGEPVKIAIAPDRVFYFPADEVRGPPPTGARRENESARVPLASVVEPAPERL